MATERENRSLEDRRAALLATVAERLGDEVTTNPSLADAINRQIDDLVAAAVALDAASSVPPDRGLAQLVGVGPEAAGELGETRVPPSVQPYDETVASERIVAVADLYYIYQHERIGVFRAIQRLQELFRAGAVFLSSGQGAYKLYQFDRRQVLRYTRNDRLAAYRRAFGYGNAAVVRGARANSDFHALFSNFNNQVALFWRDKRISDVLRERAYDPSFGSIAIVRRAGLDLRNNLKFMSYGHLNVLRVEVMQLLDEAFRIVGADDVKRLFGADNGWDVIEEVLTRYFGITPVTSPRQRMAVTGRRILRWLGQQFVLEESRPQFEAKLKLIADDAEEWRTSAQSIGIVPADPGRRVTLRPSPAVPAMPRPRARQREERVV